MPDLSEKCGVFGIFDPGFEAARIVHPALWALQHRGQESSGIASSDGKTIRIHRGMGLVAHVYDEKALKNLKGYIAIGHNRYSTSHGSLPEHSQPVITKDGLLALAHNGNLPTTRALEKFLKSHGIPTHGHNDSELIHEAVKYYLVKGFSVEKAIQECWPLFTCAFDTIGATLVRDVRPGEMVVFDKNGLESHQLAEGEQRLDIFEFVYFSRPDSVLLGQSVNEVRKNLGRNLARECPIEADVVIPVPDSAIH